MTPFTIRINKYGTKHTVSATNIKAKIGETYERIRTVGVYIREGKDMRTHSTFE